MATSILRMVAACWASLESKRIRSSLVTPSTMDATVGPNSASRSVDGHPGVLDRIVQQGGGDGGVVQAEAGEDGGHGQGVGDVGLAGFAHLALVGPFGHVEGPDDHGRLGLWDDVPGRRRAGGQERPRPDHPGDATAAPARRWPRRVPEWRIDCRSGPFPGSLSTSFLFIPD